MDSKEDICLENITFSDITLNEIEKKIDVIKALSSSWSNLSSQLSVKLNNSNGYERNSSIRSLNAITETQKLSETKSTYCPNINIPEIQKQIKHWGLPDSILKKYESKGVTKMFTWQVECLGNSRVLEEYGNLVYSAPTSAGKTLVAEMITIKTVLERQKKVIIILPFVSVVREKMFYFQDLFSESGIRVEGFMGSYTPPGGFDSVNIAVCTIEKANNLINRLLEEGKISELGAVIVDELHLLGDPNRGYILELLLSKLLYATKKNENTHVQIIGMSATLPNLELLSNWLQADLYKTDFRPIPLKEHCMVSNIIYDSELNEVKHLERPHPALNDKDYIISLCLETIMQGCSVLIFCPTKNWCENLGQQIASAFRSLGYSDSEYGLKMREQLDGQSINEVLEQLKASPVGLDGVLRSTISFGVAYHHAGLTMDERDIIEGGFKNSSIRVLVATSTLSSGVNLPAKRVIVRSPIFNSKPINILTYKQMIGRAGRMGIDSSGESVLICSNKEKPIASHLMKGTLDPVESCLEGDDKFMRVILEAIASETAISDNDINLYVNCTLLLNSSLIDEKSNDLINITIKRLKEYELIRQQNENDSLYIATPLGKACLSSSMAPQDGLNLFIELQKARESFVLETDLHMIYLVTPYSICNQWGDLNWLQYLNIWETLSTSMKRVGRLVGIQESVLYSCTRNANYIKKPSMLKKYPIYKRFYTSLALQDLVNEVPLNTVADKFNCSRGMLQSLQQSASTFAGMVTAFTQQLGWKNFEILVSQFQDRLYFGIQSELLDLMKLQSLNGLRARAVFNAGIESISQLANANILLIENALNSVVPFQSEKVREGEHEFDAFKRNNMKNIWITGKKGITSKKAAKLLILEARSYLQLEFGIQEIKWDYNISNEISRLECKDIKVKADHCESISNNDLSNKHIENTTINFSGKNSILHSTPQNDHKFTKSSAEFLTPCNNLDDKKNSMVNNNENRSVLLHNIQQNDNNFSRLNSESLIMSSDSGNITHDSNTSLFENSFVDSNLQDLGRSSKLNTSEANEYKIIDKSVSIIKSDNSENLFDDSIILNTQLVGVLDDKLKNESKEINMLSVVQNANSLEKVFASSFDTFEDSSRYLKLISNVKKRKKTSIIEMEDKENTLCSNQPPIKCIKLDNCLVLSHHNVTPDSLELINDYSSIDIKLIKNNNEIKSYNDFDELKMIYCCHNKNVFDYFTSWIMKKQIISICLNVKKLPINKIIGGNFFDIKENETIKKCSNGVVFIEGIALYTNDNNNVFYFDLQSNGVLLQDVISFLDNLFNDPSKKIISHNSKSVFLTLLKCCGIKINCCWEDLLVADWLLDSEGLVKSISKLAEVYCNMNLDYFLKTNVEYETENCEKIICVYAWLIKKIMCSIKNVLHEGHSKMIDIFYTEMKSLQVLADCESNGVHFNKDHATTLLHQIKNIQKNLESKAFKLTGRRFNFTSSNEVAKVIGIYKGRKVSTNKQALEKIDKPLSQLVIYWRKLNTVLTKNILPLLSKIEKEPHHKKIFGVYWTHTSTGRITMQEPNLQNTPRSFLIPSEFTVKDQQSQEIRNIYIICRNFIVPTFQNVFVSADYCQLELRLLAHMSQDATLLKILNSSGDIFKAIASVWKCIDEEEVDDDLRQKTKHLCYGIIYGMGIKRLADNLDMCTSEAEMFLKAFHYAYPGINIFINKTIENCKRIGYIETISGRRRYLPLIKSKNICEKSHAERQAVNTTIQGSAADILKLAMISVNQRLKEVYKGKPEIKLVLLLHDELMYEVPINEVNKFSTLFKQCMENTIQLTVPLPVKVRCGESWGELKEISF